MGYLEEDTSEDFPSISPSSMSFSSINPIQRVFFNKSLDSSFQKASLGKSHSKEEVWEISFQRESSKPQLSPRSKEEVWKDPVHSNNIKHVVGHIVRMR